MKKILITSSLLLMLASGFAQWQRMNGLAKDISIGSDGSVWVIGISSQPGNNYEIFQRNGLDWRRVNGGAVTITVDSKGTPWVVSAQGEIFKRDKIFNSWNKLSGAAKDIAAGADGSIWVIGTTEQPGGNYEIFKWNGFDWAKVDGLGVKIAVDNTGAPWVLTAKGEIYKRDKNWNSWRKQPGLAKDIATGADGSVWVIGTTKLSGGNYEIFKWNGIDWRRVEGASVGITVDNTGAPWVVTANNEIFRWTLASTSIANPTRPIINPPVRNKGVTDKLFASKNDALFPGDKLTSQNGKYYLTYQSDGNLVLYTTISNRALWATNTNGRSAYRVAMQTDGNFMVYSAPNTAIWKTNTLDKQAVLILQDDGNLVIYSGNNPIWSSNTAQR